MICISATFHKLYVINKLNLSVNVRIHVCYKLLESFMTLNALFSHYYINYATINCDILLAIIIYQILVKESKITHFTYFCNICDFTLRCWHLVDVWWMLDNSTSFCYLLINIMKDIFLFNKNILTLRHYILH